MSRSFLTQTNIQRLLKGSLVFSNRTPKDKQMPRYVLVKSTDEANEDHCGYVAYELQSELNLIAMESLDRTAGNQHIHTVTVKHDGPGADDSVYTFEEWMNALGYASTRR